MSLVRNGNAAFATKAAVVDASSHSTFFFFSWITGASVKVVCLYVETVPKGPLRVYISFSRRGQLFPMFFSSKEQKSGCVFLCLEVPGALRPVGVCQSVPTMAVSEMTPV